MLCDHCGEFDPHLAGACTPARPNVRLLELGARAYMEEARQQYGITQGAAVFTAMLAELVANPRRSQLRSAYRPRRRR